MCRIRFPRKVLYPSDCQEFVVPGANAITVRCESPSSGVYHPRNGGGPEARTGSTVYRPPYRKWQGRRMRCPYARPARRGSDSPVPRAREFGRVRERCPYLYLIRTDPAGWKGQGNPPGTPLLRFPVPGARGGSSMHICIIIGTNDPRDEQIHHRLLCISLA